MNLQLQIIEDLKQHDNNDEIFSTIDLDKIDVHTVFANYRRGRGLRLTRGGLLLMQKRYDSYKIKLKSQTPIKTKHLITLEKHLPYPYYITDKVLVLFSGKDAVDFKLYDGDLVRWCESKLLMNR
ncbi:MAG: hypothetical protein CXT73_01700 [Methanobacteriota archaeon]|jgi:hypothetical protein|nr:MAG: hypothetical protein CXT73_01700 [Euryarchaeota archaeon]